MSDDLTIPNPDYRGNRAGRYGTGSSQGRRGMDPDTSRLVMFAGGLGAVLLVLVGASTLIGHRSGDVPTIVADPRPIRVKPENPGGMKIDGAENDVFSGGSDTADSRLAPAAEKPDAKAMRPAAAVASPAVPVVGSTADAMPAPAIVTRAGPVTVKPTVVASAGPAKPMVVASAVPAKPVVVASSLLAKPLAAVVTDAHPPGHQAMVQLAALGSEDAARAEWQQLSKRMPDLINGRQPIYSRTERDGHTFWRVRTSGFADQAQARAFCDHVHAKGGGCSIADF